MNPSSVRDWVAARGRAYVTVLVVLSLNVPFLVAALARHLSGVEWLGLGAFYAGLVFLGYYVLILLALVTALFLATAVSRRLFLAASATLLTLALFYLVVNGVVHRALRMHVDLFWLEYLVTSFGGVGIDPGTILGALAILGIIVALEWWLFRMAARVRRPGLLAVGLAASCVLAFMVSQVLHIAAYEANETRITAITPQLPFYYPVTSHDEAVKYGGLLPMIGEDGARPGSDPGVSLRYPLRDVVCRLPPEARRPNILLLLLESWRADALDSVVTPAMHALSRRSSVFLNHFSSGNATPTGVFPLFYGIHPTYWAGVKANNAAIHNPVLIDALEANGYAFGIYAQSHFDRHKIKDAIFRGIEVHEPFEGETPDARDRDMTERIYRFMEDRHGEGTPFFGFAYYKSTHYSYHYPPESAPFQPARDLNVLTAGPGTDPTPYLNDYLNSVHWVDRLLGGLIERMEGAGILENTIVIVTSDHGEQFNDNRSNYWGHTGNFTRFQTQVPMIVYVPWEPPRTVTAVTSQVDLAPTLLQEGLGCGRDARAYSNGRNLFGPLENERAVVSASYVNHALIMGDDVFAVYPMYVQKYKLDDINAEAGTPPPHLMQEALEGMGRFYGSREAGAQPPR